MKLLAELACARAPEEAPKVLPRKETAETQVYEYKEQLEPPVKKNKNPIKELFERKKELHEKKQQEKLKISKSSSDKTKKQKKSKLVQHNLPLIRTSQFRGGMAERKKRRDSGTTAIAGGFFAKKKEQNGQSKNTITKDVYDFDEEESVNEPAFSTVLSYRAKAEYQPKELNMSALLSKTIGETLTNGKTITAMGENLESMVDRKFKDIEKYAPKPKVEEKPPQPSVIGIKSIVL